MRKKAYIESGERKIAFEFPIHDKVDGVKVRAKCMTDFEICVQSMLSAVLYLREKYGVHDENIFICIAFGFLNIFGLWRGRKRNKQEEKKPSETIYTNSRSTAPAAVNVIQQLLPRK